MADKGKTINKTASTPVASVNEEKRAKSGNFLFGILAFLVATAILVVILGGVFFIVMRNNVLGLAEKYRMTIKEIPVLRLALPKPPDPDDERYMSESQVRSKYRQLLAARNELLQQLEALQNQLRELENEKEELAKAVTESEAKKAEIEAKENQLKEMEERLAKEKEEIDTLIARGDMNGFKEYFEGVNPETAQKIYSEIVKGESVNQEITKLSKLYETMDAKDAARILENMSSDEMDMVVGIIKNMKSANAAQILAKMDVRLSASITRKMAEADD